MPIRKDANGNPQFGPSWESLSERLIREAMERGEFDELPFKGRRIPLDDETYAGENALGYHVLKNAGVAPPWIEADKEARRQLGARDRILARAATVRTEPIREQLRREMRRTVGDANAAIERLNAEAPTLAQHRRPLRLEEELGRLERAFEP